MANRVTSRVRTLGRAMLALVIIASLLTLQPPTPVGAAGTDLIYITEDGTLTATRDADRAALFTSFGYSITVIDDDTDQATLDGLALSHDLVFIANSASSFSLIQNRLRGLDIGVVSEDTGTWGGLMYSAGSSSGGTSSTNLNFVGPVPGSAGSPSGSTPVYSSSAPLSYWPSSTTALPAGVSVAAEIVTNSDHDALFSVDTGGALYSANTAANRRVFTPFGNSEVPQWTVTTTSVMRDLLAWAAGSFLVVNSTGDAVDSNPGDGVCDTGGTNSEGDPECTLRAAIEEANASANIDTIEFNIPNSDPGHVYYQDNAAAGFGAPAATTLADASITDFDADYPVAPFSWWNIQVTANLPDVVGPVTIDGTTQPGWQANTATGGDPRTTVLPIVITSDGSYIMNVEGSGTTIRGLNFSATDSSGTMLFVDGSNQTVEGSWFMVDPVGVANGPGDQGIWVVTLSSDITIGGPDPEDHLLIGNGGSNSGLTVISDGATVDNVWIGSQVTGDARLPFWNDIPFYVSGNDNLIGTSGVGVVVSASINDLLILEGDRNVVQSSMFGFLPDGTPSEDDYASVEGNDNLLGGTGAGEGNAFNSGEAGWSALTLSNGTGNSALGNTYTGSQYLLIDVGDDGPNANDPGDLDVGDNGLLNHPEITSVAPSGATATVDFDLDVPAGDYRIEFYADVTEPRNPLGYGAGEVFVGAASVTHTGSGVEAFSASITDSGEYWLAATATEDLGGGDYGSTSEFGPTDCVGDSDSDGLCDGYEQQLGDTDGDSLNNDVDADDDNDTTPTASENADPNGDGDPRDALDTDRDGQPDYLDGPTTVTEGTVAALQKISDTSGGFSASLNNDDQIGRRADAVGDLDGDGITDLVIGAYQDDDGGTDRGAVYVLFLNADGSVKAEQKISDTTGGLTAALADGDWFGSGVAAIGDLDGDGVIDIAVGAARADDGGTDRGAVYVLFLNVDGTVKAEQKISDTTGGLSTVLDGPDWFGVSLAGIGDLDGDGVPDLTVGANNDDDGGSDRGAVYILFLNSDGTVKADQKISDTSGGLVAPLDNAGYFGSSVADLGDIDGDGNLDIAVGNPLDGDGGTERGAVHILRLNTDGTVKAEQKISDTTGGLTAILDDGDRFGTSVGGIGDLDRDGVPDLAIGAILDDDGATSAGAVYLVNLNPDGSVAAEEKLSGAGGPLSAELEGDDILGSAVTGLGDLDGNGSIDLAVGASQDDDGGTNRGAVYILDLTALSTEVTVNSTGDAADASAGDGVCDTGNTILGGAAECTLRAAIQEANANAEVDTISFDIPVSDSGHATGVWTIDPSTPFDEFSSTVVIDGSTQPGHVANTTSFPALMDSSLAIQIDGSALPADSTGLVFGADASDSVVRGLSVVGVPGPGIEIDGSDRVSVVGNHLGVGADGTTVAGNTVGVDIRDLGGAETRIGSALPGDRNMITGNTYAGIALNGPSATDTIVQGNDIGLLRSGPAPVVPSFGIVAFNGSGGTLVGGTGPGEGNRITRQAYGLLFDANSADASGGVVGNHIWDNLVAGIDNLLDGNTPNDVGDGDVGPNDLLNYPDLTEVTESGGTVTVTFDLDVPVHGEQYRVEFFTNPSGADTYGEGELFVSSIVTGPGTGLTHSFAGAPGEVVTATSTRINSASTHGFDRTSEFSLAVTACGDADGDGLLDCQEDANTDADDDPATTPGPDTDGDLTPNYLDADDDGDGTPTASENADPNGDGDPRDALDTDRDGQPDYLDLPVIGASFPIVAEQKISSTVGGLVGPLANGDQIGEGVAGIGDLDGDGTNDLIIGASGDDDGGTNTGAVYITFLNTDGTVRNEQKISATAGGLAYPIQPGDYFGHGVASVGDLDGDGRSEVAVGSWEASSGGSNRGAVDILFLNADGTVRNEQRISAIEGGLSATVDDSDRWGAVVAAPGDIDGDGFPDLLIGSPFDDDGQVDAGAAAILFINADGTVRDEQKISALEGGLPITLEASDQFGFGVTGLDDVNGDGTPDVAVGIENGGINDDGSFVVLLLNPDGTVLAGQEVGEGIGGFVGTLDPNATFGREIQGVGDLDGDGTVDVIATAVRNDGRGSDRGAIHLLSLNDDGTVLAQQELSDGVGGLVGPLDDGDQFGSRVAVLGDLDGDGTISLAVGARFDDDGGSDRGAVYVVELCGRIDSDGDGLWDCEEDANTDLDGDPATNPGPDSDGDTTPNYLDADDDGDGIPTASENADPNGDGDPRDALDTDRDGEPDYLDIEAEPSTTPIADEQKISDLAGGLTVTLDDDDFFGGGVTAIGDVDGDGIIDMAVGASGDDDGASEAGALHILFMNADGTVKAEQKISDSQGGLDVALASGDGFGHDVAGLGDVDGDGIPDLAVGSVRNDDGGTDRGAVDVLLLNADGTVRAEQRISSTSGGFPWPLDDGDEFGTSVGSVGDVDGDGIVDLVVGAKSDDDGGSARGAVYVLMLNADGSVRAAQKISDTEGGLAATLDDGDAFGRSVAGLGDVDGDGTPDVAVGVENDDDGGANRGAVHVLLLDVDGTVRGEQKISDTTGGLGATLDDGDAFGLAVAGPGDVDGDGTPDLVVGAYRDDDGGADRGAVYLLSLGVTGAVIAEQKISSTAGGLTGPLADGDWFGVAVGAIGDLDSDGTLNLLVGARRDDDGGTDRGAVYVLDLVLLLDTDGDGLWDHQEDANTDADGDPSTNPGPDTDGDTTPNYLDTDDDGDGILTTAENADPNADGDPRDALDSDRDGEPDYLDRPTNNSSATVAEEWKVSSTTGGLTGPLDNEDVFGSVTSVGDIDGDGIVDVAVGSGGDDDGGPDRGAVFVLLMNADGTVRAEQKISDIAGGLVNGLADGDRFGASVVGPGDIDGDGVADLVVGAPLDDDGGGGDRGAVYVLFLNNDGSVRAEQKISASTGGLTATLDTNDNFGGAVAGPGDIDVDGVVDIAVGAARDGDGGSNRGAVYVLFLNGDGTVKAEQKISDAAGGFNAIFDDDDRFGTGVAGIGDVDSDGIPDIAVGVQLDDDGGSNRGAVHILRLNSDGTVAAEQKISSSVGGLGAAIDNGDRFGTSIAGLGDLDNDGVVDIAVGSPFDGDGGVRRGALHVLLLNADGSVRAEQKISSTAGGLTGPLNDDDRFGASVSSVGDLDDDGVISLAVGAPLDDDGGTDRGAVYILDLTAACVAGDSDSDGLEDCEEDANTDADNDPSTSPGPDTDGDTTPNYLDADDDGDGTPTASENADPNSDGDPRDALDTERNGQPDYLDGPSGLTTGAVAEEQKISDLFGGLAAALADDDGFGYSVTSIGDLDGDGIVDVAVGAPDSDRGGTDNGAVYVLFMNADGTVKAEQEISATAGGLAATIDGFDAFGYAVAGLGDLDGDGLGDLVVGAEDDDDGGSARGAVYVLFLNADGTVKAEQKMSSLSGGLTGTLDNFDRFGSSVAALGDVDGDGLNDIAVGATLDDDGGDARGAVHVLFLNADGTVKGEQKISDTVGGLAATLDDIDQFGSSVAGLGDVDGDGIADLAVGAPSDDDGGSMTGAAYVLLLNADGTVKGEQKLSSLAGGVSSPLGVGDQFGTAVSGIGDLDGNGVADLLVGSNADDGGTARGAVYVLFLNSDGTVLADQMISDTSGQLATPLDNLDYFGSAIASVGDLDGDGTPGLIVGAWGDDDGGGERGAAYVLDLERYFAPLTVNSTGDASDLTPGDGICDTGGTNAIALDECTLRAAIEEANASGPAAISFDIPFADSGQVGGVWTFSPPTRYPALTVPMVIDGSTQATFVANTNPAPQGLNGTQVLFIDGSATPAGHDGFWIQANDVEIRGFAIGGFQTAGGFGVQVDGDRATIVGNYLSMEADGLTPAPTAYGVAVDADDAIIGGFDPADRNLITGQDNSGVLIIDGDGSQVLGNLFGTDASGTVDLVGFSDGVQSWSSTNLRIGAPGAGNVIGGDSYGIEVGGSDSIIENNLVGTNGDYSLNIGGFAPIGLFGSGHSVIDNVFVNSNLGMRIDAFDSVVTGNSIGTDPTGTMDLGMTGYGISVEATGVTIGGDTPADANVITFNGGNAIESDSGINPTILGNRLYSNGGLGIDIDADGFTANSNIDTALNHPVITDAAEAAGIVTVDFDLDVPAGDYRIEAFSNPSGPDASGNGEGEVFEGATTITHTGSGLEAFQISYSGTSPYRVALTATEESAGPAYGATSEFSTTTLCVDSDSDGLCDPAEDANTDADNDPATNPGPDTDGDTTPNYLDADDDDDGTPTSAENADPNSDGDPRDALDADRDGEPDYLDVEAGPSSTPIADELKISSTSGGLVGPIGDGNGFGGAVASMGDLDGDGVSDLAVGEYGDDAIQVLFLNADGSVKAEQEISSTAGGLTTAVAGSGFGYEIANVGDLDGDGTNDLVAGLGADDDGGTNWGAVLVLFLNPDGTVKAEQKISDLSGGLTAALFDNGYFGNSVTGLGDLDGDGVNDIAVGGNEDNVYTGAVYVLFLNVDGTVKAEQKISATEGGLTGPLEDYDNFGYSVAGIGDLDGDGTTDIVVGAVDDDGSFGAGAVYVLFLNVDGTVKAEQKISATQGGLVGPLSGDDSFGFSVAGVGDLDGNGTPDIAVGATRDGVDSQGEMYLLSLNADGTVRGEALISSTVGGLTGPIDNGDYFAMSIAGLGDLDNDGSLNLAVGAFWDDDGGNNRGAVYMLDLSRYFAPLTVNSTGDAGDLTPGDGICDTGGDNAIALDECTLRAAIEETNASGVATGIGFDIPFADSGQVGGVWTISPSSGFDLINVPVTIDGTTQAGFATAPVVQIDGASAGDIDAINLQPGAADSTIRSLAIGSFERNAIDTSADRTLIVGNHLGLDAAGTTAQPVGEAVVFVDGAADVLIGGTTALDRNVIGAGANGIVLSGATDTVITGNFLGTDVTGNAGLGSFGFDAIRPESTALRTVIGGSAPGAGNVIGRTNDDGIDIRGTDTRVEGNSIGISLDGLVAIDLQDDGISIGGNGTEVIDNVIGNPGDNGIEMGGTRNNITIQGNVIGSNAALTVGHPPGRESIQVTGTATSVRIGGINPGDGNTLVNTPVPYPAISVRDVGADDVAILGNVIDADFLSIDLGEDGSTLNDAFDADGGANDLMNYPEPSVTSLGTTGPVPSVTFTVGLDVSLDVPAGDYRVEVFSNDQPGFGGAGNGQQLVHAFTVTHPGGGSQVFPTSYSGPEPVSISATATEDFGGGLYGSTSEMSPAFPQLVNAATVNSSGDAGDADINDGICDTGGVNSEGATECTMRAAIEHTNRTANGTIDFNLPASDPGYVTADEYWAIDPIATYPDLVGSGLTIDGSSQPGFDGSRPVVQLSGLLGDGLTLVGDDITVQHLSIGSPSDDALQIQGERALIDAVWVGVDPTGAVDGSVGTGSEGIIIYNGSNNLVVSNSRVSGFDSGIVSNSGIVDATITNTEITGNRNGGIQFNNLGRITSLGNSIYDNVGLGIELSAANGVPLPNDVGDLDSGGNDLLNYPVLTNTTVGAGTVDVDYTIDVPAGTYRIEFFDSDRPDPTGFGEGQTFLSAESIVHPGGSASYTATVTAAAGDVITATATPDLGGGVYGGTSEFSNAALIGIVFVNSTADTGDLAPGDGNCDTGATNVDGFVECTLRAAIEEANASADLDIIHFQIPETDPGFAAGIWTIAPATAFPALTDTVDLDASSQPGFIANTAPAPQGLNGQPVVQIQPTSSVSVVEFQAGSSGSTLRGFVINSHDGITIWSSNVTVVGNYIGIDPSGTIARPGVNNVFSVFSTDATIGGIDPADRNLISGHGSSIYVNADRATIVGNIIGADVSGTTPVGTQERNITIRRSDTTVGGTAAGSANLITGPGIGVSVDGGTGNSIIGNVIFGNTDFGGNVGVGIDLSPTNAEDGPTPNDVNDVDTGSNDYLNFPEITSATTSGGTTAITFTLDVPAGDYRIEAFSNPSGADPTGFGEGEVLLGAATVTHLGGGSQTFDFTVAGTGVNVSMTTTEDLGGGSFGATSEFSGTATPVAAATVADISPRQTDLTAAGGSDPTVPVPGVGGAGINLDGGLERLVGPPTDITSNAFTMSAWVNLDTAGNDPRIIAKGEGAGTIYELFIDDGTSEAVGRMDIGGVLAEVRGGSVLPGAWHHVVASWNGGTLTLFVDGAVVDTAGAVGSLTVDLDAPLAIGNTSVGASGLDGTLDQLELHHRSLTTAEVMARFRNGQNPAAFVSIGAAQTAAPAPWTTSALQSRTGGNALAAPLTNPGADAWITAVGVNEPGVEMTAWWWVSNPAITDVAAGTRTGPAATDQFDASATGAGLDLAELAGATRTSVDTDPTTLAAGTWQQVVMTTDELGNTTFALDGTVRLGPTALSGEPSGSVGFRAADIFGGEQWFIDDVMVRRLVSDEPTTSLGPLERN